MSERRCTTPISPPRSPLDSGFSKRLRFPLVAIRWPALFLWVESSPFLPPALSSSGWFPSFFRTQLRQFLLITPEHLSVCSRCTLIAICLVHGVVSYFRSGSWYFPLNSQNTNQYCPEKVPGNVRWKEVNMLEIHLVNASKTGLTHHIFHRLICRPHQLHYSITYFVPS